MITLLRKDLEFSLAEREKALAQITSTLPPQHVLVLTCNRVELYTGDGEVSPEVARHLFRVVSGLESALLGETAIQGQVKEAYKLSMEKKTISQGLHRLFQNALRVGKRVRTDTRITRGAMSHSQAAIEIIKQHHHDLTQTRVLVIGVNKMMDSVLKYLLRHKCSSLTIANRTIEKAVEQAQIHGAKAISLLDIQRHLQETDILITATSAPHTIIAYDDFPKDKPMLIIDLAVPRDVDEKIGTIPGVTLLNIEDVEKTVVTNQNLRQNERREAEMIVEEEVKKLITQDTYAPLSA